MDKKKTYRPKGELAPVYLWTIGYLKPYYVKLTALILCGIVASLGEMAIPKATQFVIDDMLPSRNWSGFVWITGMLAAAIPLIFAAHAAQTILERTISELASRDLQLAVLDHLHALGVEYYEKNPVGSTLSLMNNDMGAAQGIFRWQFPYLFQQFAMLLAILAFMATINWRLSLLIVPPAILFYLIGPGIIRRTFTHGRQTSKLRNEYNKKVYESISAIYDLRANSALEWDWDRLADKQKEVHVSWTKQLYYSYMRASLSYVMLALGLSGVVIAASYFLRQGTLTVGEFVAFMFYYMLSVYSIMGVLNNLASQRVSMFQVKRIYDLMQVRPSVREAEHPVVQPRIEGAIELQGVGFRYSPDAPNVLEHIDLEIRAGEHVAIVGTSGGGKSTLLKLLARFYDPSGGVILLDGVPLRELSMEQLHHTVGYVFQETYLFGSSIRDNLMFGNPDADEAAMLQASEHAAVHDFVKNLPDGYDTIVGDRGIKLSGGQKQRIAIARMILKNPRVVLLDEATSALDRLSEKEVQRSLDLLLQGRTTITVAHRLSTVEHVDRIVLLSDGMISEEGTYGELMSLQGEFYRLVKGQAMEEPA